MKTAATDQQLDRKAVAALAGFKNTNAVNIYRRRGAIPEPDGYIGSSPWWWQSTIDTWNATRRNGTTTHPKESHDAAPEPLDADPDPPRPGRVRKRTVEAQAPRS